MSLLVKQIVLVYMFSNMIGFNRGFVSQSGRILCKNYSRSTFLLMSEKRKVLKPTEWRLKKLISKEKQKSTIKDLHANLDPDSLVNGLVIERLSDKLLVELTSPTATMSQVVCSQKDYLSKSYIVAGDIVDFTFTDEEKSNACVVNLHERKNVLQRPSVGSGANKLTLKPIASNIDQLIVVSAAVPRVPSSVLDRYLVAAHSYVIPEVTLLINKFDLPSSEQLYDEMEHYGKLGYDMIKTSTVQENGLDDLRARLADKTSIFVGQSGVGKSSLINCLLPDAHIRTGELVNHGNSGAHTTSNARLYHLPGGGSIIDSPGIRELGTWHLDRSTILEGFPEIKEASLHCKYRNCCHSETEAAVAHCGVREGIRDGSVHVRRFLSYIALTRT